MTFEEWFDTKYPEDAALIQMEAVGAISHLDGMISRYRRADMKVAYAAGRVAALEDAAKVCDLYNYGQAPSMIKDALRSMK